MDTIRKKLGSVQLRSLSEHGERISKLGVNFAVCDCAGELVMLSSGDCYQSDVEQLKEFGMRALDEYDCSEPQGYSGVVVWRFGDENVVLACVLRFGNSRGAFASGVVLLDLGPADGDIWTGVESNSDGAHWMEMLRLVAENFHATNKAEEQIEMVGTELAQTYEELVLLHRLSTNMRVTEHDANFLQMACDSLTEIVPVEGIAILLEKRTDGGNQLRVAAGGGVIDVGEHMAGILHSRLVEEVECGGEALLDSEVDSPFKYDWPENVRNIMAVPLYGIENIDSATGEKVQEMARIIGLMVAINRAEKQDFDSIDAKLFHSVANSCAVFIENGRLFGDIKELFIGSLKALTSSIDAKDQYTRGHSERVAFISRWIAERLGESQFLTEEQVHKIYLAGLLHDIGKIGVDESVLRKRGKLTSAEFGCIKKHPLIGAGILREIKQMRDIVPGVLYHHERIDGRGYPSGLVGDQMPLIGKIVGLADSFDAMTSKRTYRDAMTVERALKEIEEGLGSQFDEKVGRVFLESDVYRLWEMLQGGPSPSGGYNDSSFAEYGIAAVGTLIR